MSLHVLIAAAVFRDDGAIPRRETVHDGGTNTTGRSAPCDDSGVYAMGDQPGLQWGFIENRRRGFDELKNILPS